MLVDRLDCPVLVKEVGAGLSAEVVGRLAAQGVRHIDLACKGGTNWALIEYLRQSPENQPVYAPFIDTGYALADAIGAARETVPDAVIIASGGLRHGLDIAKSLWLGANMGGMAGAMLRQLEDDDKKLHPERLASALDMLKTQIRTALFSVWRLISDCIKTHQNRPLAISCLAEIVQFPSKQSYFSKKWTNFEIFGKKLIPIEI